MKERRWFWRLHCFYKILNNQAPAYLYSYFPQQIDIIITETVSNFFLPQTIREWKKRDPSIFQAPSYSVFRKPLSDFIRPTAKCTFGTNDFNFWFKIIDTSSCWLQPSQRTNLNVIFKIHWNHCALVPGKQKTPITFLYAAKFFLINEMPFSMTLIHLTQEILKMSENKIVRVLLFGKKGLTKDINFRIITS